MYDIIGDIHGHADQLEALLEKLEYRKTDEGYRHPSQTALFVGDFIDRGPQIAETLRLVREMVESGAAQAVMGNHEFNAIAYHAIAPSRHRGFLRVHTEKNNTQHAETLKQLTGAELAEAVAWFRTLPLYLDLGDCRLVHACWSQRDLAIIDDALAEHGGLTDEFMEEATDCHSPLFHAIEHVLKGPEMNLPAGQAYEDKDGHRRIKARIQWFRKPPLGNIANYTFPESEAPLGSLSASFEPEVQPYDPEAPPVFFGHYWLQGTPQPQTDNAACVDYSVARGGKLVAYCWTGEPTLVAENFQSA